MFELKFGHRNTAIPCVKCKGKLASEREITTREESEAFGRNRNNEIFVCETCGYRTTFRRANTDNGYHRQKKDYKVPSLIIKAESITIVYEDAPTEISPLVTESRRHRLLRDADRAESFAQSPGRTEQEKANFLDIAAKLRERAEACSS